jgi:hypothetical protein
VGLLQFTLRSGKLLGTQGVLLHKGTKLHLDGTDDRPRLSQALIKGTTQARAGSKTKANAG